MISMTDRQTSGIRRFLTAPGMILTGTVLTGLALLAFFFFRNHNIYRDVAYCYAYAVQEAASGNFSYALDPGLPVMNMLSAVPFALAGVEAYHALMLAGGLFWLLTLIPLYFFLRLFVRRELAAAGCLFYILTPKLIRFSCCGLPEAPRNFFLLLAVLMLFLLQERKTAGRTLLFAFSLAGLTLSRAEGLVVAGVLFLFLLIDGFRKSRRQAAASGFRRFAVRHLLFCAAAGLLTLAFLSPRLAYQIAKTGYPTPDTRYNPYVNAVFHLDRFVKPPTDFPSVPEVKKSAAAHSKPKGFNWFKQFKAVFSGFARGSYEVYLGLAALGLLLCLFRFSYPYTLLKIDVPEIVSRGWCWEFTQLWLLTLVHAVLYFIDCSAYRYYTFFVPFAILWALIPLDLLLRASTRLPFRPAVTALLAAGFLALAFFQIRNAVSFVFEGRAERSLGLMLKEHAREFRSQGRPRIHSGYAEVAYYSGFEYSNSSLNSKSRTLTAREGDFDLAVFPAGDDRCKEFSDKFGLEEWKNNPCAESMTVLVPRRDRTRR